MHVTNPVSTRKPAPATPHCVSFGRAFRPGCAAGRRFITPEELETSGYLLEDWFTVQCDIEVVQTLVHVDTIVPVADLERMGLICGCQDKSCKRRHAGEAASTSASAPNRRWSSIKAAWVVGTAHQENGLKPRPLSIDTRSLFKLLLSVNLMLALLDGIKHALFE